MDAMLARLRAMLLAEWREIDWPGMVALSGGVLSALILLQALVTLVVLFSETWTRNPSPFALLGQALVFPLVLIPLFGAVRMTVLGIRLQIRKHQEMSKTNQELP